MSRTLATELLLFRLPISHDLLRTGQLSCSMAAETCKKGIGNSHISHWRQFQNYLHSSMISDSYGSSKAIEWGLRRIRSKRGLVASFSFATIISWIQRKEGRKLCHFQNSFLLHLQGKNQAVVNASSWTCVIAFESQQLFLSPWRKGIDCSCCFEADFSD